MALEYGKVYRVRNGYRIDNMNYMGERVIEGRTYNTFRRNRRVHHLFRNLRTNRVVELKTLSRVLNLGVN